MNPPAFDLRRTPLEPSVTVLEASAGTGKTYAIAGLFLRLIVQRGIPAEQLLVVTFTRAATAELRDRIRRLLVLARRSLRGSVSGGDAPLAREILEDAPADQRTKEALLATALENFDEAPICTLDSFCQRALQEHAFATGTLFDSEFVTDSSAALTQLVDDFWRRRFYGDTQAAAARLAVAAGVTSAGLSALARAVLTHPEVELRPQFDSTLRTPHSALESGPVTERARIEAEVARLPAGAEIPEDLTGPWQTALKVELLTHARAQLSRLLEHDRQLTFGDLRQRLDDALHSPHAETLVQRLRQRYRVALIDEFQDTDPVQFRIFHRLFADGAGGQQLYLVGDPKQAIYSFRGADVFAYLAARGRATRRFTLTANWRSEQPLVRAVNAVFNHAAGTGRPFVVEAIPFAPVEARGRADAAPFFDHGRKGAGLRLWHWEPDAELSHAEEQRRHVAAVVAAEAERLLGDAEFHPADGSPRALRPQDLAVLVASHHEADLIAAALRARGIPSVQHTQDRVFTTDEAWELLLVLAALLAGGNDRALRAAAATSLLGWTAAQLDAGAPGPSAWTALTRRFRDHAQRWEQHGLLAMWQGLLVDEQVHERLLRLPDGERRFTNFQHLAELCQHAATTGGLGRQALADWLEAQVTAEGAGQEDEALLRLEHDDAAVKLVTIHSSKGLEYPVVFCPFLFQPFTSRREPAVFFHDPEAGLRLTADLAGVNVADEHKDLATGEQFAEKIRLAYVALTRARHRCYVVWGPIQRRQGGFEKSPLGWLLHPPPDAATAGLTGALAALKQHLKPDKTPRPLRPELEALSKQSGGALEIQELPPLDSALRTPHSALAPSPATPTTPGEAVHPRSFTGVIETDWRVTSYTALTARRHPVAVEESDAEPVTAPPPAALPDPFRGTGAGNCLHAIFEQYPRPEHGAAGLEPLVQAQLRAHGFDAAALAAPVLDMVRRTLRTPLSLAGTPVPLDAVPPTDWRCEVPFHLPLRRLTPAALAAAVRESPRAAEWTGWPRELEELAFEPVRGFLTGKIDLIFPHAGRFYLVDWKSNWLGPEPGDYTPDRVFAEMRSAQYLLQYHLYALALDQHLRRRVPGYDYDRDFGGVFYLFVRGVGPERPELGVFADRPPAALMQVLADRLLAAAAGGAA